MEANHFTGNKITKSSNESFDGKSEITSFQKHQMLLKSVLEKLNLDVNYDRHVTKNTKPLPRKYFENVEASHTSVADKFNSNDNTTKDNKAKQEPNKLRTSKSAISNNSTAKVSLAYPKLEHNVSSERINNKLKGSCKTREMYEKKIYCTPERNLCTWKRDSKQPTELFNPDFNFNSSYYRSQSSGRKLLESIKNKVFSEYSFTCQDGSLFVTENRIV